jgi:hypothetical protein
MMNDASRTDAISYSINSKGRCRAPPSRPGAPPGAAVGQGGVDSVPELTVRLTNRRAPGEPARCSRGAPELPITGIAAARGGRLSAVRLVASSFGGLRKDQVADGHPARRGGGYPPAPVVGQRHPTDKGASAGIDYLRLLFPAYQVGRAPPWATCRATASPTYLSRIPR